MLLQRSLAEEAAAVTVDLDPPDATGYTLPRTSWPHHRPRAVAAASSYGRRRPGSLSGGVLSATDDGKPNADEILAQATRVPAGRTRQVAAVANGNAS